MCKAYAAEGGALYQNQDMLKDITNILDFLCGSCYTAKSQTDNWWTWEIGIPKDLIPALILIYDGLTEEQVMAYTETLYFSSLIRSMKALSIRQAPMGRDIVRRRERILSTVPQRQWDWEH